MGGNILVRCLGVARAMIDYITVYATYDPLSQETLDKMSAKAQEIASAVKDSEDRGKVALGVVMGILGLFLAWSGDSK